MAFARPVEGSRVPGSAHLTGLGLPVAAHLGQGQELQPPEVVVLPVGRAPRTSSCFVVAMGIEPAVLGPGEVLVRRAALVPDGRLRVHAAGRDLGGLT